MLTALLLCAVGADPAADYSLWEARISNLERRADKADADIDEIRNDIGEIRRMLTPEAVQVAEKPKKPRLPPPCSCEDCVWCKCDPCTCGFVHTAGGTTQPDIVVLSPPFPCPACDALKARLRSKGIDYTERVDATRSSWPVLLVDGIEVSAGAVLNASGQASRLSAESQVTTAGTIETMASEPMQQPAVRRRRGPLRFLGNLFRGKRSRGGMRGRVMTTSSSRMTGG